MWGEAVLSSIYLINRLQTKALPKMCVPAEVWYGQKPNFDKIKRFGCTAYNLIPKQLRLKLDSHCNKLKMIGYAENGYRLWDENERKIVHARNVVFDEESEQNSNMRNVENLLQDDEESQPKLLEKEDLKDSDGKVCESQKENRNEKERSGKRKIRLPKYLEDYELNEESGLFTALDKLSELYEMKYFKNEDNLFRIRDCKTE
nr:unnamed protein product [Callosobruchus analis]